MVGDPDKDVGETAIFHQDPAYPVVGRPLVMHGGDQPVDVDQGAGQLAEMVFFQPDTSSPEVSGSGRGERGCETSVFA